MSAGRDALPAMPLSPAMADLQAQLDRSQWWSAEQLQSYQQRQLAQLLEHTWQQVPFHRPRLEAAGWAPGRALEPAVWARLPLLTRRELQAPGQALRSAVLPPEHGKTIEVRSSGSTGTPVEALVTGRTNFMWKAITLREQLWQRRDFSLTFGVIRRFPSGTAAYPAGERIKRWADEVMLPFPTGPSVRLDTRTPLEQQAEWLRRQSLGYLVTYPSILAGLARLGHRGELPLPGLRQLATISEVLPPELRGECREAWGVGIAENYSAEEVGYVALQCPDFEHLHVQAEAALVEILDQQGRTCQPGEVGQVVVTPLHNYAMPLLRYEIGDYAEVGPACPCGRGLAVLSRVMGRVRNMLVLPDGGRFWPTFGMRAFSDIAPVRQHQFIQRTRERIEARLVCDQPLGVEQEAALRARLQQKLLHPFAIDIVYVADIPRTAGGKFEDFRSEVA